MFYESMKLGFFIIIKFYFLFHIRVSIIEALVYANKVGKLL